MWKVEFPTKWKTIFPICDKLPVIIIITGKINGKN